MNDLLIWAAIGIGGATGALLRGLVYRSMAPRHAIDAEGPWTRLGTARSTLVVNVVGSFGLGCAVGGTLDPVFVEGLLGDAFWTTGLFGGLTTFSTLCADGIGLTERGDAIAAGALLLANLALGTGALVLGMAL